jgi:hypothetical protein
MGRLLRSRALFPVSGEGTCWKADLFGGPTPVADRDLKIIRDADDASNQLRVPFASYPHASLNPWGKLEWLSVLSKRDLGTRVVSGAYDVCPSLRAQDDRRARSEVRALDHSTGTLDGLLDGPYPTLTGLWDLVDG